MRSRVLECRPYNVLKWISIIHLFVYAPTPLYLQGLRNVTDACERHDPCQHEGICISTDSGPICECRNTEYEGMYCERGKSHLIRINTMHGRGRTSLPVCLSSFQWKGSA